jgi:excisionase family DNA binding protein
VLLSLQAAAGELGVPFTTLYDFTTSGVLPVVRFPGSRRIRVKRTDVQRFVEASVERRGNL